MIKLSDFWYSDKALSKNINNYPPTEEIMNNIILLKKNVVDKLELNFPNLKIGSGYRNEEVNRLVGGVEKSQHIEGKAVDLYAIQTGTNQERLKANQKLYDFISDRGNGIPFDQLILEINEKGFSWVHVSYNKNGNRGYTSQTEQSNNVEKVYGDKEVTPATPDTKDTIVRLAKLPPGLSVMDKIEYCRQYGIGIINKNGELDFQGLDSLNEVIVPNGGKIPVTNKQLSKSISVDNEVDKIKNGTPIAVEADKYQVDWTQLSNGTNFLEQGDYFDAYWSENYTKLIEDKDFVADNNLSVSGDLKIKNLNIRVWIYSKVLGQIIDVSPFVIATSTSKTKEVGSFSITLPPVKEGTEWFRFIQDYVHIYNTGNVDGTFPTNYFEKIFQNNDLVFIRFEKLFLEGELQQSYSGSTKDAEIGSSGDLIIPNSRLANKDNDSDYKVWDMIGLIDTVNVDYSSNYDMSVVISGRDLTKLIIDDGSYFIPLYNLGGGDSGFWAAQGSNRYSDWYKRNVITGRFDNFFSVTEKRIKETLGFILSQLINLEVIDDEVFDSYSGRQSKILDFTENGELKSEEAHGIWKIVRVFVDKIVNERTVVDPSFGNPDGSIQDLFNRLCQYPFVEFWGDTYIDTFDFVVRQPPFTMSAICNIKDTGKYITVKASDLYDYSLHYSNEYYSWYQLQAQNDLLKTSGASSLVWIPIIFYDEITKKFGNKRLIVSDIYLGLDEFYGNKTKNDYMQFAQALLNDLLYVVETSIYLPFTRKGVISLNGDRRIKVGTFIKLEPTDELFYVTGVEQIYTSGSSLDRITRLTVERGMKWDYIKRISNGKASQIIDNNFGSDEVMSTTVDTYDNTTNSYFNIVNIQQIRDTIIAERTKNVPNAFGSGEYGFNKDVFEFFLKRRHL